jgi:hypothetical protein
MLRANSMLALHENGGIVQGEVKKRGVKRTVSLHMGG